jgi:lysine 2,3-aminomutase
MSIAATTLRTTDDLLRAGLVPTERVDGLAAVAARYAVAIPPAMAALIDPIDADDPIARQFLPDPRELVTRPDESPDPIGDALKSPVAGLVHRYPDRVLLKLTGLCPVYCRFCFRREMVGPGKAEALTDSQLEAALAYIRAHPAIWEVILTGGDPLILSPRRIAAVSEALAAIPHAQVRRWHTRVPVAAPERVTPALVAALTAAPGTVAVAVHANHPRELTSDARMALGLIQRAGVLLLGQTVLLKGVNDDADTLEALMRSFVAAGVKPYYLHHPDRAPGTSHFRVTIRNGQALMAELRRRLSGIALPTYVLDLPGAHGKVSIEASRITAVEGGWRIVDAAGRPHVYEEMPAGR